MKKKIVAVHLELVYVTRKAKVMIKKHVIYAFQIVMIWVLTQKLLKVMKEKERVLVLLQVVLVTTVWKILMKRHVDYALKAALVQTALA